MDAQVAVLPEVLPEPLRFLKSILRSARGLPPRDPRRYAIELLEQRDGGGDYLLKQRIAAVRTFTAELRRVQAGGTALDPDAVAVHVSRATKTSGPIGNMTPRQLEVLGLMAEGRSNAHIAALLGTSEKSVVQHTAKIYDTFDLPVAADDHRRVLAVIQYLAAAGAADADVGTT